MELKLITLKITNFKGIKSFEYSPSNRDSVLYGDNGTCKTTVADAWAWLLTGKDSNQANDFEIKELDKNNKPILGQNHEVEAILTIDGEPLSMKKILTEKWQKKRGLADKIMTGHETEYFINDVSCRMKDYQENIDNICPEEALNSIIQPGFFCTMSTEKKRSLLLDICGDIAFNDIIASDKVLSSLPGKIGNHSVDDFKKIATSSKKKHNKSLAGIPARIDENLLKKIDMNGLKIASLKQDIKDFTTLKQECETLLASSDETLMYRQAKTELDLALTKIESGFMADKQARKNKFQISITKAEKKKARAHESIIERQADIKNKKKNIDLAALQMTRLREDWTEKNKLKFSETHCSHCGQELKDEALETAKKMFNQAKAEKLKAINAKGLSLKQANGVYEKRIAVIEDEIKLFDVDKTKANSSIKSVQNDIKAIDEQKVDNDSEYKDIQTEISGLKLPSENDTREVKEQIKTYGNNIAGLNRSLQKFDDNLALDTRNIELEGSAKDLATKIEQAEGDIALCDLFTRTKTGLLEHNVNEFFDITKFKMFQEMLNGEIRDVCIAMVGGVPYTHNLNLGHRVMADIDIIKTLSKHYDVSLPIFVDNSESVTVLPDIDTQIIKLIKPDITPENKDYYAKLKTEPFLIK